MPMADFDQIVQSIPDRFKTDKVSGYSGIFHFDISGDGYPFTVEITNNNCVLTKGLNGIAQCVVKTTADNYTKLELGQINPTMAVMTGKVKVSNVSAMMEFSKLFYKFRADKLTIQEQSDRPEKQGPLKGIQILDFTRLLPGPMATMLLGDMGAQIIKIEDPDSPDYIRNFPPTLDGTAAYYMACNRGKKSLAICYTKPEAKEVLHKLVTEADVLIEQFRPGVMSKFGLGYEDLKKINPKLIYVSITGYGQTGPYAKRAGHDLNYIAESGFLGVTGNANGPAIPGGQVADIAAGSYMAVNACLAAIISRDRTGIGQHVDVAMLDGMIPLTVFAMADHSALGKEAGPGKHELSGKQPNYNVYKTSDNRYMALGALEPKFWNCFCDGVNKPEWKEGIVGHQEELDELKNEVAALFMSQPSQYWVNFAAQHDCCLSLVKTIDEVANNEQLKHRGSIMQEGKLLSPGIPIQFSDTPGQTGWPAPKLGIDNESILTGLGLSEADILKLTKSGVI